MTRCNSEKIKLSNSKLDKLKQGIKSETRVTLRLSSSLIGNSNGKTDFST